MLSQYIQDCNIKLIKGGCWLLSNICGRDSCQMVAVKWERSVQLYWWERLSCLERIVFEMGESRQRRWHDMKGPSDWYGDDYAQLHILATWYLIGGCMIMIKRTKSLLTWKSCPTRCFMVGTCTFVLYNNMFVGDVSYLHFGGDVPCWKDVKCIIR